MCLGGDTGGDEHTTLRWWGVSRSEREAEGEEKEEGGEIDDSLCVPCSFFFSPSPACLNIETAGWSVTPPLNRAACLIRGAGGRCGRSGRGILSQERDAPGVDPRPPRAGRSARRLA